ncbi:MAG: NYN domain-containing protein [Candidatus Omnitrophica bacterium]|nr:NYN domain-containing protein [Candidatus Omnitrophota bacterium]
MTTLILDGYNVIHAVGFLQAEMRRGPETARLSLRLICTQYLCRYKGVKAAIIVYDGAGRGATRDARARHGVTEVFSGAGEEADDRIVSLIRDRADRADCTVVTNDNYVSNNSRAHGASVMSVGEFQRRIDPGPKPDSRRGRNASAESPDAGRELTQKQKKEITDEYRRQLFGQ